MPTCPGWTADDLLLHLTEVQLFWAGIVEGPVLDGAGVEAVEAAKPDRPGDRTGLLALSEGATARLVAALRAGSPGSPAWSWHAPDQTMGFTYRRQAHEAYIHRVDAELTAGEPVTSIDAELASDGIDEMVRIMWGVPDWGTFHPGSEVVELEATDTGDAWRVQLGRFTGVGPQSGRDLDMPTAVAVADAAPTARVRGSAAEIDLWLWNRSTPVLDRAGSDPAIAELVALIGAGVD